MNRISDPERVVRLARAVVSDIALYHPELVMDGLANDDLFERKRKPREGDWLAQQHEPGQSFNQYVAVNPPGAAAHGMVVISVAASMAISAGLIV